MFGFGFSVLWEVRSLHNKRFVRWVFCLLLCVGSVGLAGCPSVLYSRKELKGAAPERDLVAASVTGPLKQGSSLQFSVRGVRLMDPIKRVHALWGPPSVKRKDHHLWKDQRGRYLARIVLGRKMHRDSRDARGDDRKRPIRWLYVVRQIDLFSHYLEKLHPRNRSLLQTSKIESVSWRTKTFGGPGRVQKDDLRRRYIYFERGFQMILFSKAYPLQKKVSSVFSLYIPASTMTLKGIFPMS